MTPRDRFREGGPPAWRQAGGLGIAVLLLAAMMTACIGPLAAQAESPPPLAEVGQKVESAGVALTVNSAQETQTIGAEQRLEQVSRPLQAGEGKIYLVANVTIENKSQYRLGYQPAQFTVHDSHGTAYNTGVAAGSQPLGRGELEPTKDVTGLLTFVVPDNASDFVLTYRIPNRDYSISVRLGV